MMTLYSTLKHAVGLLLFMSQLVSHGAGTQFASHVSVNTPARSFTHGVGDPIPQLGSRIYHRQSSLRIPTRNRGYPRVRPVIPFTQEDLNNRDSAHNISPWQHKYNYREVAIPVLPPSPYKVDSPDPESLWPEGLLMPSFNSERFGTSGHRRSEVLSEAAYLDPYLLEGSEAVAAVKRASRHGHLFFHDIPHIESLLANQELREENNLKPHRIASIRHTWPYNRP